MDALYKEAEERQQEQGISLDDINGRPAHSMYSAVPSYSNSNLCQPPIAQVMPVTQQIQQQFQAELPQSRVNNNMYEMAEQGNKRQKISEGADFTSPNSSFLKKSRFTSAPIEVVVEEDKVEVQLINELQTSATSQQPQKNSNNAGLKTLSEAIPTNHADKLKEKQEEIKMLEKVEESKVID